MENFTNATSQLASGFEGFLHFCYIEFIDGNGKRIEKGANLVPVLPDKRFIIYVEDGKPKKGKGESVESKNLNNGKEQK